MRTKDFSRLLEVIISTAGAGERNEAWLKLTSIPTEDRKKLFEQAAGDRQPIDLATWNFLYTWGHYFQEEVISLLSKCPGDRTGWPLMAMQYRSKKVRVNGKFSSPFIPIESHDVLEIVETPIEPINAFLETRLRKCEFNPEDFVLGLSRCPSCGLLLALTRFASKPDLWEAGRYLAALAARDVASGLLDEAYFEEARRDAKLAQAIGEIERSVRNRSLDASLRFELASILPLLPSAQSPAAVQALISEIESNGSGSDFLTDLRDLRSLIESQLLDGNEDKPDEPAFPEMDGPGLAAYVVHLAGNRPVNIPGISKNVIQGRIVYENLEMTKGSRIVYSEKVLGACRNILQHLAKEDAETGTAYSAILSQALWESGLEASAFEWSCYASSLASQNGMQEVLIPALQIAAKSRGTTPSADKAERLASLAFSSFETAQECMEAGDLNRSEALFQMARELAKGIDREIEAAALGSLAILSMQRGNARNAIERLEEARDIQSEIGDDVNLATTLMELGLANSKAGNTDEARELLVQAIALSEKLEGPDQLTALPYALYNQAHIEIEAGRSLSAEAKEALSKALDLARKRKDSGLEVKVLALLRGSDEGNFGFKESLQEYQAIAEASGSTSVMESLNATLRECDVLEDRIRFMFEDEREEMADLLLCNLVDAYTYLAYLEELDIVSHYRAVSELVATSLPAKSQDIANQIVSLLIEVEEVDWALEFSTRSKAQSLLPLCVLANLRAVSGELDPKSLPCLFELSNTARRLVAKVHEPYYDEVLDSADRLEYANAVRTASTLPGVGLQRLGIGNAALDFEAMRQEVRKMDAWNKAPKGPMPSVREGWLSTRIIPGISSVLDRDECIVDYCHVSGEIAALIQYPAGNPVSIRLGLGWDELEELMEPISSLDTQFLPVNDEEWPDLSPTLAAMGERLIDPVLDLIRRNKEIRRLVIVPQGRLCNVPFGALRIKPGRYLVNDFELNVLPSAALLSFLRIPAAKPGTPIQVALLGDPETSRTRLPEALREIRAIAQALHSADHSVRMVSGPDLTPQAFIKALTEADVVHFAGHVDFDSINPLDSFIPLSGGSGPDSESRLTCRDMLQKAHGRAQLLFFSACQSGRSGDGGLNEFTGFVRAGLLGGARNIVHSLWPLPDNHKVADLIAGFYSRISTSGESYSGALRGAQLAASRLHPLYWGGLQLAGADR